MLKEKIIFNAQLKLVFDLPTYYYNNKLKKSMNLNHTYMGGNNFYLFKSIKLQQPIHAYLY